MNIFLVYLSASDHSADLFPSFEEAYVEWRELMGDTSEPVPMEEVRKRVMDGTPVVFELNDGNWLSFMMINPRNTAMIISALKPEKELRYYFDVQVSGVGTTMEEAWLDAIEHFCNDPGDPQGALRVEEVEE